MPFEASIAEANRSSSRCCVSNNSGYSDYLADAVCVVAQF